MTITKKQVDYICNVKSGWSEEAHKALEERERFNLNYTPSLHEAWERVSQDSPNETRYEKDCIRLFYLTKRQLNLEKNAKKGDFEGLEIYHETNINLLSLIEDEFSELKDELLEATFSCHDPDCECGGNYDCYKEKKKINYQRAREEIGDVAACLVGLLAKLNKLEEEEK